VRLDAATVVDPFGVSAAGGWDAAAPPDVPPGAQVVDNMGTVVVTAAKPVDWITWALLAALGAGLYLATRKGWR
jgi:hypothetical protein